MIQRRSFISSLVAAVALSPFLCRMKEEIEQVLPENVEFEMGLKCNLDLRNPNTNATPEFTSWLDDCFGPLEPSPEPVVGRDVLQTNAILKC